MRFMMMALTAVCLAPTAAMASVSSGELVANSESRTAAAVVQKLELAPVGQRGSAAGNMILAKGDQSGSGPGVGGQKGQKKGGHKGKQQDGKDNPGRGRGPNRS